MQKTSIISILLCMTAISAHGDIASKAYVDSVSSDIQAQINERANKSGYTPERILQTDDSGNVTADFLRTDMISNGAVTNSRLSSGLGLDKMDVGELPTSGKHIMIWNGTTQKYVFEAFAESASSGLQCPAGQYDIGFDQCVDPNVKGSARGHYSLDGSQKENETTYGLTTPGEWGVTFDGYGTVKGIASCNRTVGHNGFWEWIIDSSNWLKPGNTLFTQDSEGEYCWCKMTSPSASGWVFDTYDDATSCAHECARLCALSAQTDSNFRSAVFGSVGQ